MTAICASGVTQVDSTDIVLASGVSTTLALAGATLDTSCVAMIQIKSTAATYMTIGTLDVYNPMRVLAAPGTFRVRKLASAVAITVERD